MVSASVSNEIAVPIGVPIGVPEGNITLRSPLGFEPTLAALRHAIAHAEMMVLHEIDTQASVPRGGIEIPGGRRILYFHPRYMKRIVETNPRAVIEAPLKFVVREAPDHAPDPDVAGTVEVNFWRPAMLFGRYQSLQPLAHELEEVAARIASALSRA